MTGHVFSHLARRGLDAAHAHYSKQPSAAVVQHSHDGTTSTDDLWTGMPIVLTAVVGILVVMSVRRDSVPLPSRP